LRVPSNHDAERRLTLKGYDVTVRTDADVVYVTRPELPQLEVRDAT